MSDAALKRLDEVLRLADSMPPAQHTEWQRTYDEALDAARVEADALVEPRALEERSGQLYERVVHAPVFGPLRSPITRMPTPSEAEANALYYESIFIDDDRVRAAVQKSIGLPPALARRLRQLAEENK